MENNQSGSDKSGGYHVSKKQAFFYVLLFVISCVFAAWLSHYFTAKSLLESEGILNESSKTCSTLLEDNSNDDGDNPHREEWKDKLSSREKIQNVRLPKSVIPESYEIKLIPFIFENNFTFRGEVKILLNVTEDINNVTLHANDLEIDPESVKVTERNGKNVLIGHLSNDTDRQFFVTHVQENLVGGRQYEIEMKFTGHLNDELQGFYRSSYGVGNAKR